MRYEVYGIYSDSGVNYGPVVVARSAKAAIDAAMNSVSHNCPKYAILVKERKCSIPLSVIVGDRGREPHREMSLVQPHPLYRLIQDQKAGAEFWKTEKF